MLNTPERQSLIQPAENTLLSAEISNYPEYSLAENIRSDVSNVAPFLYHPAGYHLQNHFLKTSRLHQLPELLPHIGGEVLWIFNHDTVASGDFLRPSGHFMGEPGIPSLPLASHDHVFGAGRNA